MIIQAEISLYPIGANDVTREIVECLDVIRNEGVRVEMGKLSSLLAGESSEVFRALHKAFDNAAQRGRIVLVSKITNAAA
ncbi:hypothetical protein GX586_04355, partial [bacterium]|nr:hypothetical protein [bacterium]